MKNCNCDTEINRDGSGQLQRYLTALDPAYAPIDGRSTEDLLLYAKRYAAQIRFYDIPDSNINDATIPAPKISWREFFRRDMAVIAASIAVTEAAGFKKEYDEINERLQHNTTPEIYAALYAPIIGMLKKIDRWYSVAIPESPLYADLKLAIDSDLKQQVQKIVAYEEGFKFVDPSVDLKIDLNSIENKDAWGLNESVPPDAAIYTGQTQAEKILSASLFTEDIFHAFYNFLNRLINDSARYIQFAMEQYPSHQPHMALFITFLQLFNKAQQQMNGLTGRLLDFYYKEVLYLQSKPAVPDKVHIVFELAKDVTEYGLADGTALKAGPDDSGKEQFYKTAGDLVINQAKVAELKTIFVEHEMKGTVNNIKSIYARPIANSSDGFGEKFEGTDTKWPTFGVGSPLQIKPVNICERIELEKALLKRKDQSQIGFAIASPQLVLQGGNRIIALQMASLHDFNNKQLEIWLSAEDGWLKIDKKITEKNELIKSLLANGGDLSTGMPGESGYFIDSLNAALYICLPIVEKAIIPFNLALHPGLKYATPYPVMQIRIEPDIEFNQVVFNQNDIKDLSISVRVGSINLPSISQEITVTGEVLDETGKQVQFQDYRVEVLGSLPIVTGQMFDGKFKFSIATSVNKILKVAHVDTANHKIRYVLVTSADFITVTLENGRGVSSLDSVLATLKAQIPSFFDGLKELTLKNDDGVITPDQSFDPFTAYPKQGSALYIGSNEIFNKPIDQTAINIKHLSDDIDAAFDIDYSLYAELLSAFGTANKTNFGFYKLSLLQQKEWFALSTPEGNNFSEGLLTRNVLFTKNSTGTGTGTGSPLPPLSRYPLIYESELKKQVIKGFMQLQWNIPITADTSTDGNVTTIKKDVFQKMAELAIVLKVKEISVSYFSKLQSLDPEIDQFFHVYPFGVTEIYSRPVTTAVENNLLAALRKKMALSYNAQEKGSGNFKKLDVAKDYLLVNANQLLLPQFTYTSPYDADIYQLSSSKATTVKRLQGMRLKMNSLKVSKEAGKKNGDAVAEELILNASGLADKIKGGANQYTGSLQEEGMLFIGMEKAKPLQMISMLFQFAEGSAADEDNDPPEIHWSYLTNNEWRPMKAESIVSDGTVGFQTTGIIKIELPEDATANNTIITKGLHWLCASVSSNSNRIPMLIDIVTQAVLANFEDNNNAQSHFDNALAAGNISKLAVVVAQVGKVQQPFASFDGKHQEIGKEFYTRASERLRHKARAITPWDYEHLVLDRFPSIYKVKCISHTDPNCLCTSINNSKQVIDTVHFPAAITEEVRNAAFAKILNELNKNEKLLVEITIYLKEMVELPEASLKAIKKILDTFLPGINFSRFSFIVSTQGEIDSSDLTLYLQDETACCGPQIAPGHVLLVPISNLKNRNAVNPLQPKTSRRVLLDIEAYLKKRTSPFVQIHAKNPVYEQVLVFFRVQFRDGFDKGFYMKKLNDEIVHYLTPWAFDDITEVKFGQKIYASSIINFIEERKYVDFITDFLMLLCRKGCCDETVKTAMGASQDTDGNDILNAITNCCDIELLLQQEPDFIGDIVAKPSTARSLLVSAPQHIIIPYQAPAVLTPCESRRLSEVPKKIMVPDIKGSITKKITESKVISVDENKPADKPAPAAMRTAKSATPNKKQAVKGKIKSSKKK